MSSYTLLNSSDSILSPIIQDGNYFIIDAEQLVCNPFQDLQEEAVAEAQKKATLSEKVTSVKNNVCENYYLMARDQIEKDELNVLKEIHDKSSKLRYEVKLLDLDRQKNTIEVKKRVMPERDYSYDEMQISNTEKRLGANIASFYLERKMKYRMRLKAGSDMIVTPIVRKAREALKLQDSTKNEERPTSDRAQTAKTSSSTNPSMIQPAVSINFQTSENRKDTYLPAIAVTQTPKSGGGHVTFKPKEKFNPLAVKNKDQDGGVSKRYRPHTYHPGQKEGSHFERRDLFFEVDDDDDDALLPDRIDLHALFSRKDGHGDTAAWVKSMPNKHLDSINILRRSQGGYAPKVTQDLIQQEYQQVKVKVDRFLQELHEHATRQSDYDSDSDSGNAPTDGNQFNTTITVPLETATSMINSHENNSISSVAEQTQKVTLDNMATPRIPKNAWKYIRGRRFDGSLEGNQTAEDLVFQTLTGVPLSRSSMTVGIPLHAASRAMRHTATFKMRKVIEKLISDRTKYQRHEIQELKKKMEGTTADENSSRKGSALEVQRSPSQLTS